jgi:hypothetical protein
MLHLRGGANLKPDGSLISSVRRSKNGKQGPGGESILRLSELMFVEVVRRYLTSMPEEQTGWLAGLRDRNVGQALNLLHGQPAWLTLGRLGKRSAFRVPRSSNDLHTLLVFHRCITLRSGACK